MTAFLPTLTRNTVLFGLLTTPALFAQSGGFSAQNLLTTSADRASGVFAIDLDGDGDIDVLSSSAFDDKIAWYENQGGGVFSTQKIISTLANGAESVYAADLDGDGDPDVLSASTSDDKVAWYENLGGGLFGPQQVISTASNGVGAVFAIDLDGDTDMDVLSASSSDGNIAWYENLGAGVFDAQKLIAAAAGAATDVHSTDLDGDGDADVLATFFSSNKVVWYENLGAGAFGVEQVISTTGSLFASVHTSDLDGDGDQDVLSASRDDSRVAWYENLGSGVIGPQQVISVGDVTGARSVYTADFDGDGDEDVVAVGSGGFNNLVWFENLGAGSFNPFHPIEPENSPQIIFGHRVFAADLDGDGDADVLTASKGDDKISWYENNVTDDCNANGVADFKDLAAGTSADCNENGIPDSCDILSSPFADIDGDGVLDDCLAPALVADLYEISLAIGGSQTMTLTAPNAGDLYLLLGSVSGTSPGIASGGFVLPLNVDSYLLRTLNAPNSPPLANSLGTLDSGGEATATFSLPLGLDPGLVSLVVHHAYATVNSTTGQVNFVSNAVPVTLLP